MKMLDDELIDRLKAASATCMAHGLLDSSIVIDLAIGEIRVLREALGSVDDELSPEPGDEQPTEDEDEEQPTFEVSVMNMFTYGVGDEVAGINLDLVTSFRYHPATGRVQSIIKVWMVDHFDSEDHLVISHEDADRLLDVMKKISVGDAG